MLHQTTYWKEQDEQVPSCQTGTVCTPCHATVSRLLAWSVLISGGTTEENVQVHKPCHRMVTVGAVPPSGQVCSTFLVSFNYMRSNNPLIQFKTSAFQFEIGQPARKSQKASSLLLCRILPIILAQLVKLFPSWKNRESFWTRFLSIFCL